MHEELAQNLVATVEKIQNFIENHQPPYIAKIYRPSPEFTKNTKPRTGRIELWLSHEDWTAI